MIGEDKVK